MHPHLRSRIIEPFLNVGPRGTSREVGKVRPVNAARAANHMTLRTFARAEEEFLPVRDLILRRHTERRFVHGMNPPCKRSYIFIRKRRESRHPAGSAGTNHSRDASRIELAQIRIVSERRSAVSTCAF